MGVGIALSFARAGAEVVLTARRDTSLKHARRDVDERLSTLVQHELVAASSEEAIRGRITTVRFAELDLEVDLILESIAEDAAAKRDILSRAESRARPSTIIATNTSSLSLKELSSALKRPENFAGYHWFNPPELVALVEVIAGPSTHPGTLEILMSWANTAGKVPALIAREVEGFVANRLQYALMREGYSLVAQGVCTLKDVDRVMKACLGPPGGRGLGPTKRWTLPDLTFISRWLKPCSPN